MEGIRMFKLPVRSWVRNAAAVFSGQYGSVTDQAQDSQCTRETVYEHARKVEERLAEASRDKSRIAEQETEIQRLQRRVSELEARAQQPVVLDPLKQRKFATVASALGLSLRQTEDLFQILLPRTRHWTIPPSAVGSKPRRNEPQRSSMYSTKSAPPRSKR